MESKKEEDYAKLLAEEAEKLKLKELMESSWGTKVIEEGIISIFLREDVCKQLARMRYPWENFSDVIERLLQHAESCEKYKAEEDRQFSDKISWLTSQSPSFKEYFAELARGIEEAKTKKITEWKAKNVPNALIEKALIWSDQWSKGMARRFTTTFFQETLAAALLFYPKALEFASKYFETKVEANGKE
jgi:hypothetical protein